MNLRFRVLIRGMREGSESHRRFSFITPAIWELPINFFASEVAYLVHLECLYLIKPMCGWFLLAVSLDSGQ